jgi:prepilin peptidase CpaA
MPSFAHPLVWVVSAALVMAAVIDGWKLKVPNWLTFPFVISGWLYHWFSGGSDAVLSSLLGTSVGLGLLLAPYIVGGMGAGDVKLFAGVGAWMGPAVTWGAFCVSAVVGGMLAVAMVASRGLRARTRRLGSSSVLTVKFDWDVVLRQFARFHLVSNELLTIRSPGRLAELAQARKPSAMLLPYGIPLAIGTIGYFFWLGLL